MDAQNPNFVGRCRNLKAHGFSVSEIMHITKADRVSVNLAVHGRATAPRRDKRSSPGERVADLIADVPEGRDPAEHRRVVLMNFGANT